MVIMVLMLVVSTVANCVCVYI